MFQRVRAAAGPLHEYSIPLALYQRRRDCYVALGEPEGSYRAPKFIQPLHAAIKPRSRKKAPDITPAGEEEVTHGE